MDWITAGTVVGVTVAAVVFGIAAYRSSHRFHTEKAARAKARRDDASTAARETGDPHQTGHYLSGKVSELKDGTAYITLRPPNAGSVAVIPDPDGKYYVGDGVTLFETKMPDGTTEWHPASGYPSWEKR